MNEVKAFIADNLSGFSLKSIPSFIFSFLVCSVLSFVLGKMYIRYGNSLSNRRSFAKNFVVLAITTMFIISVVKSSLALSLGLVGALSIVRFRSAIKEPEELTYLFLTIAIGLGCGAGLAMLTVIAFIGFIFVIWFNSKTQKEIQSQSIYLTIVSNKPAVLNTAKIVEILKQHASAIKFKRSDETQGIIEVSFYIEFERFDEMENAKRNLKALDDSVTLTLMDNTRDL